MQSRRRLARTHDQPPGQVKLIGVHCHRFALDQGGAWFAGTTTVLQVDTITLVVTSRPVHLFDRSLFLAHGCDPRQFDLVVVKSPHCQPHMFEEGAQLLINVDAPGSTSANLQSLGHTRCARPTFPLDGNVTFTPKVKIFRRDR